MYNSVNPLVDTILVFGIFLMIWLCYQHPGDYDG